MESIWKVFDEKNILTDNWIIERSIGRAQSVPEFTRCCVDFGVHRNTLKARLLKRSLSKMRKVSKKLKELKKPKRYFVAYNKGKYNLIPLSLKKKGHAQKYYV